MKVKNRRFGILGMARSGISAAAKIKELSGIAFISEYKNETEIANSKQIKDTFKNAGLKMAIIAGDVQTENDAVRLRTAGAAQAFPIVTNGACHLDAKMVKLALEQIDLDTIALLIIENVGNLVCPSSYDLGEDMKVVIISVTEGDDKPLKYPGMFRRSSMMVINKTDLKDQTKIKRDAIAELVAKGWDVVVVSAKTGRGINGAFVSLIEKMLDN